jgi:uncharacterized protein YbjQ (UPF0145 family)
MFLTNTEMIPGKTITTCHGVVSGSTVRAIHGTFRGITRRGN